MEQFDLIVIGGGGAGRETATRALRDHGASVAVVNPGVWGGICRSTACKPTKQLLVAAELLHDLRSVGADLGIEADAVFSLAALKARKDWLIGTPDRWRKGFEDAGFTLVDEPGELLDAATVRAGDRVLTAPRIAIATGSRTAVPPIDGLAGVPWLDHAAALELTEVPESLLVLGAGPVGLEFAQMFSRFGSRVTVVQTGDRIATRGDADAAAELRRALEAEGIEVATATVVTRVRRDGGAIVATLAPRDGGPARDLRVVELLVASGRAPNVEGLGLEALGVETGRGGIVTDDRMRTSVPGVWAVGDCVAAPQLTPVGAEQAQVAVGSMFGDGRRALTTDCLPTAIFTDPELAGVGLSERDAVAAGLDVGTSTVPAANLMRTYYTARRDETPAGLVKLVYDRGSRRLLGLHVVARAAGELVQGWAAALALGVTLDDIAGGIYAFPTVGEAVHYAAEQALAELAAR